MPKRPFYAVIFVNCVRGSTCGPWLAAENFSRIVTMFPHGHASIYRDADEYSLWNKYYISDPFPATFLDNDVSKLFVRCTEYHTPTNALIVRLILI